MTNLARSLSENPFAVGLFGGLGLGIPLMILGLGEIGTAVLMIGLFGGLLAETVLSDEESAAETDSAADTEAAEDDELDALRQRYVEGDLTEAEFERRVEAHLADDETIEEPLDTDRSRETEPATDR